MNINFTAGELVVLSVLLEERIKFIKKQLADYADLNLNSHDSYWNDALKTAKSAHEKIESTH